MGPRRLRHALRDVPRARPPAGRPRARRRRRRGAPADGHRRGCRAALPLGRRRRLRPAAGAHRGHGLEVGAVNPNTFQDPDYRRLGEPSRPRCAREGRRAPAGVRRSRPRSAPVRSRCGSPTAPTTRTTCASAAPASWTAWASCTRPCRPIRSCSSSTSSSSRPSTRPIADWGSALRICQRLGERAGPRRPRAPRPGHQRRADRRAARRGALAASTSTTASTPTMT